MMVLRERHHVGGARRQQVLKMFPSVKLRSQVADRRFHLSKSEVHGLVPLGGMTEVKRAEMEGTGGWSVLHGLPPRLGLISTAED